MTLLDDTLIVDADGHIFEDVGAIRDLMPKVYRSGPASFPPNSPFPPVDHLHSSTLFKLPEQAFDTTVDPDGWIAFLEDVGIASAVLPHLGALLRQDRKRRLGDRCLPRL